ncbi:MAG: hypothetical protein Q9195_008141 [Heterodermia aff. obscurata]
MSKLLTVFGATGAQGGSVVSYVLQNSELSKIYRIRGITRDVTKPAAVALKEKGVEIVKADMDDPASLVDAVEGSYAVFAVTNYWERTSQAVEIAQGKAIADAAVAAGASLLIWSSLPHISKISNGKFTRVYHFDSKAEVEIYVRGLPIKSLFYMAGFYMQNFQTMFRPKLGDDGTPQLNLSWPAHTRLPLIDIADTGKFVAPALFDPVKYDGKRFSAATAYYESGPLVEAFSKDAGKEVKYVEGGPEASNMPPEIATALKEMKGFIEDLEYFGPTGKEDLEWTLAQLKDKPTTWESFVEANGPWFGSK